MTALIKKHQLALFIILFQFGSVCLLTGATYYIDPINGDINNSGAVDHPWDTLEQVFRKNKTIAAGDTLYLLNGHHGSATIRGMNSDYVAILALANHQPSLNKITFTFAAKWKLSGVTISPETAPVYSQTTLLTIYDSASEIMVENCSFYSVKNSAPWSKSEWVAKSCNGASVKGDRNVIRNNHFLNIKHGILVESTAEHNLIDHNIIENFSADGMRGIGSYNTFQYNTVKNCYKVDNNHDDGFQSYSYSPEGVGKTTVYEIILRGNTIINNVDPDQKFKGPLQAIGCFDGMFEDWVIENNVIITDHWHGISLYGARNCKIVNNTLVDINESSPGPPWIKITAHKNGMKSSNNIIRNNLTTSLSNDANIGEVDFNLIVTNYAAYFVDYENFDLRLKKGCRAIDAGTDEEAPRIDIVGTSRPQGAGYDIGAYEYVEPTAVSNKQMIKPTTFKLYNYPNPFNSYTIIKYHLPGASPVELSIYSLLGKKVATLVHEYQCAGEYRVQFNADNLASGLYFCKMKAHGIDQIRKMIVQK